MGRGSNHPQSAGQAFGRFTWTEQRPQRPRKAAAVRAELIAELARSSENCSSETEITMNEHSFIAHHRNQYWRQYWRAERSSVGIIMTIAQLFEGDVVHKHTFEPLTDAAWQQAVTRILAGDSIFFDRYIKVSLAKNTKIPRSLLKLDALVGNPEFSINFDVPAWELYRDWLATDHQARQARR